MMKIKNAAWFTLWLCGLILIWQTVQTILVPKWLRGHSTQPPYTEIVEGFYDEPKDSLDVVFIGSSQVYCDINPLYLWNEYGIASYDFASGSQPMHVSYYYMQEVFKTQSPQVVFLDMNSYNQGYNMLESRNRSAYEYAKNSIEKWIAIRDSLENQTEDDERWESYFDYLFPIARYHSRYEELEEQDFTFLLADKHNELHGFYPRKFVYSIESFFLEATPGTVSEQCIRYLIMMKELCNEHGAELVLLKTPKSTWSVGNYQAVCKAAEEVGLQYLDYNYDFESTGIDIRTDFSDKTHTNLYGANKVSKCLGDYLVKTYELPDHRGEAEYERWDEDYLYYLSFIETLPTKR